MNEPSLPPDASTTPPPSPGTDGALALTPNSPLVFLMAVSSGLAVATLYYSQPLLSTLADVFGVSQRTIGLVAALTQLGYVAGLALLVPLGDLLDRRRLAATMSAASMVALVVAAISPGVATFLLASLLIGLTAVSAQVLVPLAAGLSSDDNRGAVVGRVMAGLLLGILFARTVSGVVADAWGWRAIFALAAVVMIGQSAVLWRVLPSQPPHSDLAYRALLRSVWSLFFDDALLRRRSAYGALGFAAFSAFWTALAFMLSGDPYNYSDSVIGLFGLIGAAGALCAAFAGQLHDRGHNNLGTGTFLALIIAAFIVLGLFNTSLVGVIAGILLLDLGQQGVHILNQSLIYQDHPAARSRVTTAYMTTFFIGGVSGSALSSLAYGLGGWSAVSWLGGAFGAIGLAIWFVDEMRQRRRTAFPITPAVARS